MLGVIQTRKFDKIPEYGPKFRYVERNANCMTAMTFNCILNASLAACYFADKKYKELDPNIKYFQFAIIGFNIFLLFATIIYWFFKARDKDYRNLMVFYTSMNVISLFCLYFPLLYYITRDRNYIKNTAYIIMTTQFILKFCVTLILVCLTWGNSIYTKAEDVRWKFVGIIGIGALISFLIFFFSGWYS